MRPVCVGVCVCVDIVFISFLEMLRFPGAKKLIFPRFWHWTPHMNWLLQKKEKKKLITVPSSGRSSPVHLCVPASMIETAFLTCPALAYLQYMYLNIDIQTCMHSEIHPHTIFPICFFYFIKNDRWEYSFCCIDCMLLWNYIFGAGWALEGRQIGLTKWE